MWSSVKVSSVNPCKVQSRRNERSGTGNSPVGAELAFRQLDPVEVEVLPNLGTALPARNTESVRKKRGSLGNIKIEELRMTFHAFPRKQGPSQGRIRCVPEILFNVGNWRKPANFVEVHLMMEGFSRNIDILKFCPTALASCYLGVDTHSRDFYV